MLKGQRMDRPTQHRFSACDKNSILIDYTIYGRFIDVFTSSIFQNWTDGCIALVMMDSALAPIQSLTLLPLSWLGLILVRVSFDQSTMILVCRQPSVASVSALVWGSYGALSILSAHSGARFGRQRVGQDAVEGKADHR